MAHQALAPREEHAPRQQAGAEAPLHALHYRILGAHLRVPGEHPADPVLVGVRKILAFITDPPTVRAILLHLDLPHRPPPLTPARGPPQAELAFDQSPAYDLAEPEPVPDFDFDQSQPEWEESEG